MKTKKITFILIIFIFAFFLTSCSKQDKDKTDNLKFKEEYESINNKTNSSGNLHRTITISADNPFVYLTPEELIQKIENKETFYVYFGSSFCPWCRSVIEKFTSVAQEYNIDKIYYIDIWDGDHVEILRDTYVLNASGVPEKSNAGADAYYQILSYFDNVLDDYTLTDNNGNTISVGEKRIFAPTFIYVENGKALKEETGISDKQTNSRDVLTEEILKDEEEKFRTFFK